MCCRWLSRCRGRGRNWPGTDREFGPESSCTLLSDPPACQIAGLRMPAADLPSPSHPCSLFQPFHVVPLLACVHLQGEILDDCVQRDGAWSCLNSDGNWSKCDLQGAPPPAEATGLVVVAQVRGAAPAGPRLHAQPRRQAAADGDTQSAVRHVVQHNSQRLHLLSHAVES